jgi:hypothetical protein
VRKYVKNGAKKRKNRLKNGDFFAFFGLVRLNFYVFYAKIESETT